MIEPQWPYLKGAYEPWIEGKRQMLLDAYHPGHLTRDIEKFIGLGPIVMFDMGHLEVSVYAINFETLPDVLASCIRVLEWAPKIAKIGGFTTLMPDRAYSPVYVPQWQE